MPGPGDAAGGTGDAAGWVPAGRGRGAGGAGCAARRAERRADTSVSDRALDSPQPIGPRGARASAIVQRSLAASSSRHRPSSRSAASHASLVPSRGQPSIERGQGVRAQRRRVGHVQRPPPSGAAEIDLGDDPVRVRQVERGEHQPPRQQRARPEALAPAPQHRRDEPAENDHQPAHERRRVEPQLGQAELRRVEPHPEERGGEHHVEEQEHDARTAGERGARRAGSRWSSQSVRGQEQRQRERRDGHQLEEPPPRIFSVAHARQLAHELVPAEEVAELHQHEGDKQQVHHRQHRADLAQAEGAAPSGTRGARDVGTAHAALSTPAVSHAQSTTVSRCDANGTSSMSSARLTRRSKTGSACIRRPPNTTATGTAATMPIAVLRARRARASTGTVAQSMSVKIECGRSRGRCAGELARPDGVVAQPRAPAAYGSQAG